MVFYTRTISTKKNMLHKSIDIPLCSWWNTIRASYMLPMAIVYTANIWSFIHKHPLGPKTMKNAGFKPPVYGLYPSKMKEKWVPMDISSQWEVLESACHNAFFHPWTLRRRYIFVPPWCEFPKHWPRQFRANPTWKPRSFQPTKQRKRSKSTPTKNNKKLKVLNLEDCFEFWLLGVFGYKIDDVVVFWSDIFKEGCGGTVPGSCSSLRFKLWISYGIFSVNDVKLKPLHLEDTPAEN